MECFSDQMVEKIVEQYKGEKHFTEVEKAQIVEHIKGCKTCKEKVDTAIFIALIPIWSNCINKTNNDRYSDRFLFNYLKNKIKRLTINNQ